MATTLGRYEILKHLAHGGMAEVLLARSTGIEGFERHVVIKRIRAEQRTNAQFVKMFLDEARLAASLHHHNVVQVHDIGQEAGEYFFAMEYVHGQDARSILMRAAAKQQLVPIEHAVTIVASAAAGLHHAHEKLGPDRRPLDIVHRDVSPGNILVGYDGGVKVVDFGIAKAAQRAAETQTGTLKGKISYMSPEQCTGKAVDRRTDVFALGIVLYELITTRRLFKADSDFLTMSAIVHGTIPPPSKFRPEIPQELTDIVLRALSSKADRRFATADEMRLALQRFASSSGLSMSTTALADYMGQQFGAPVEPWLTDVEAPLDNNADFDAAATGVVRPPDEAIEDFALPDVSLAGNAPIVKARTKAITGAPPGFTNVEPALLPVVATRPSTQSETPMAWTPIEPAPRKKAWLIGGGVVAALALVVILASGVLSGHDSAPAAAQPAAAPPIAVEPPNVEPPKVEPPKVEPPRVEPPRVEPPDDRARGSARDGTRKPDPLAKKPDPVKKPDPKKPDPKKPPDHWDGNALFPE